MKPKKELLWSPRVCICMYVEYNVFLISKLAPYALYVES